MRLWGRKILNVVWATVLFLVIMSGIVAFLFALDFGTTSPYFGVSFSQKYANELGLDWRNAYEAVIHDLGVSHVRLSAYWDLVEPEQHRFQFADLDWQVAVASQEGRNIVMAVGRRLPRWPECHEPSWTRELSEEEIRTAQLDYVEQIIYRYRDEQAIIAWQVENEPLFNWFGHCPDADIDFLRKEVNLVDSLDDRPIIITDSGELNDWRRAASVGDVLGVTMYRIVGHPVFGLWDYFFVPPGLYTLKSSVALWNNTAHKTIVTELQMEPWTFEKNMTELTLEEQRLSFDLARFRENVDYVKKTGFEGVYLWGVEYWYWLSLNGDEALWEEARELWR